MDKVQIVIEPQRICPCGKSYIPMSSQERAAYDEVVRRIDEDRRSAGGPSAEKDEEHSADTSCRK